MTRLLLSTLLVAMAGCADASNETSDGMDHSTMVQGDTEWITLFDGTSMDAWRGYQQEGMPAGWMIDSTGAMVAHDPGAGNDLVTRETFADFELEFEWKVPEEGNSGVMFRVTEDNDYPWMSGPEYQVLDDMHFSDGEPNKNSAGSNYDVHVPSVRANKPSGEWNTGRLVVHGDHVEHWLNGQKVVEYELHSDQWVADRDSSKWAQWSDTYGMADEGYIALQGDHTSVAFRNIRIRRL
jgi:hypothetical protein